MSSTYTDSIRSMCKFPHCDERVVHTPNLCEFCDMWPEYQQARVDGKVNFTGENLPGLLPCPSDAARGLAGAHVWGGNRPRFNDGDPFTDAEKAWFK